MELNDMSVEDLKNVNLEELIKEKEKEYNERKEKINGSIWLEMKNYLKILLEKIKIN